MCSINHELKAIYFHIPKNGGLYIEKVLQKYYNFQTYYITANNHSDYFDGNHVKNNISEFKGFLNIRTKGIYRYFINSKNFNHISKMDDEKWKSYTKFTFVRNPYERCVSAYKYLKLYNIPLEKCLSNSSILNNYEYVHLIISQYEHLINNNNIIEFDYIGKFENLNEELISILLKLGVNEMKHLYYIENNIVINSSNEISKKNYLNDDVIMLINNLFESDFKNFNYIMFNSYENYNLSKEKKDIIEENKKILEKYNFIKPYESLVINKSSDIFIVKSDRPTKKDIENDIKNNILMRLS